MLAIHLVMSFLHPFAFLMFSFFMQFPLTDIQPIVFIVTDRCYQTRKQGKTVTEL